MYKQFDILRVTEECGIRLKANVRPLSGEIRCHCPFCASTASRYTASINTRRGLFYCHKCGEGHNALTLYAKIVGTSNKQAHRELQAFAA